jgi:L,D-transpeptidase catalytic domain
MAEARKLEELDAGKAKPAAGASKSRKPGTTARTAETTTRGSFPLRNPDFPNTYIKQISVSLDDPDHWMTLEWTGSDADEQETGPFRTSPGAGVKGINCDITSTSRRSGTKCTPKGTFYVEGFQSSLNSDSRAKHVTWFQQWRGIALHYFPSVPPYAASHGCVRIESKRIAQIIHDNSRVDRTKVIISGTWTKPPKQW